MRRRELGEQRVERRRLVAGQEREDAARLREQALEHGARDLVEASRRPRPARRRRGRATLPFRTATPFNCTSREAIVTAPVATASTASAIAPAFSSASREGSNATSAASPACSDRVGTTRTGFDACSAACSALMITLPLFGSRITSAPGAARSRRRGRPSTGSSSAAVDDARSEALEQRPVAGAGRDGDDRARGALRRRARRAAAAPRAAGSARACSRSRRPRSMPRATPSESARPGSSVCTCTFSAVRSPTTSSESPSCSSSASSARRRGARPRRRRRCSSGSCDSSWWIASMPDASSRLGRRRARLARERRGDAADDLDEPGGAGVDDAGLASAPAASRACGRHDSSPARDDRGEVAAALGRLGHLADRRQHRPLDRLLDRAVGGVARRAERAREVVASRRATSVAPRTICDRITPELPRAPISAARETSSARPARSSGPSSSQRLDDRAHGQRQVRAGVAVGHRDRRSGRRCAGGCASIAARAPCDELARALLSRALPARAG